jgi:hypothetical protein
MSVGRNECDGRERERSQNDEEKGALEQGRQAKFTSMWVFV